MTRGIGGIRVGRNSQNYSWPKCFKWSFPENYQLYHFASQNPNYEHSASSTASIFVSLFPNTSMKATIGTQKYSRPYSEARTMTVVSPEPRLVLFIMRIRNIK